MEKATLEDVVQRLDRLEKMVTEVNERFSWLVEKLLPDIPQHNEVAAALRAAEALKKQQARRTYR